QQERLQKAECQVKLWRTLIASCRCKLKVASNLIDSATEDVAAVFNRLGGARKGLANVTSVEAMTSAIGGRAGRGRRRRGVVARGGLVVVGVAAKPIQVSPLQLIGASRSAVGHASGASIDLQDTLAFSTLSGARAMIETMPLARAAEDLCADDAENVSKDHAGRRCSTAVCGNRAKA